MSTPVVTALRASVDRLRDLVAPMDDAALAAHAYPSEWSVAQVLSHLGSGAVIMQRRLEDGRKGEATPDDFAPGVWDVWNGKSDRAMADDSLVADQALVDRIAATTEAERASASFALGPMSLDFAALVGLRLNEHVLHTWDIDVVQRPGAVVPTDAAAVVIDNLELIARFTGKVAGEPRAITVHTTEPARRFRLDVGAEAVVLSSGADTSAGADLTLPAEAFIRLVYGRLDPDHTPAVDGDAALLDQLRAIYPGP